MAQDEPLVGEVLGGRYRLVKLLGQGGMGAVYEARQEDLGRKVAVKLLHSALADDAHAIARFRREAEAAASLGHPNIVQVSDFGRDDEHGAFLVMELLGGRSLASVIASEAPLDDARVGKLAAQVLHALSAAHAAGIVHRDLKPDNVFLVSVAGVELVKLLDFGIAKLRDGGDTAKLTSTGSVMGTPAYMSPEQARGRTVDHRTDLYALGVCMYEALTGRTPFRGSSYNELLFAITEDTPPAMDTLREGLDARIAGVVQRAMEKDAARRFSSAEEMLAALEGKALIPATKVHDAIASAPTLPSGAALPVPERARARPWWPWALGVAAVVGIALTFGRTPPSPPPTSVASPPPIAPPSAMAPVTQQTAFAPPPSSMVVPALAEPEPEPEPEVAAGPVRLGRVYVADFDQLTPALELETAINTRAVRACAGDYMPSNDYTVVRFNVVRHRTRGVRMLAHDPLNPRVERCLSSALRAVRFSDEVPDGPYDVSLTSLAGDSLAR